MGLEGAARGAAAGAVAALPYGIAHWIFIAPAVPPIVAGTIAGAIAGSAVGWALARTSARPGPGRLALVLAALALPLAAASFAARPLAGDGPALWPVALATSAAWAWGLGRLQRFGVPLRLALVGVALVVAGPGEPFVHEGPKPAILLFFLGLVATLALAGALAAYVTRDRGTETSRT